VPDQYLGDFIAKRTGKILTLWPGYCPTHVRILPEDILARKREHPEAKVVVHPECRPDVVALADEALSTSGIIRYAARDDVKELIVGTEVEILHRLHKENPGKKFYAASLKAVCPNMKKITLDKILASLETLTPQITVPEEIRIRAKAAVDRMLAMV
jgi:quinolinate synthase